jgi:16S rRNA (guanine527-N7)-methyltransferase
VRSSAATTASAVQQGLHDVLAEARSRGLIGHQPISRQVLHARGFALVCEAMLDGVSQVRASSERRRLLDLGAGGGLPGLVLACSPPVGIDSVVLLEASSRRSDWLRAAVVSLQIAERAEVLVERAEVAGRAVSRRGRHDVVVARAFGRPAVTAECAAPLLQAGGILVVAEPPGTGSAHAPANASATCWPLGPADSDRWPAEGLAELGLGPATTCMANGFAYVAMKMLGSCSDRYPRRTGVPAKRPLF